MRAFVAGQWAQLGDDGRSGGSGSGGGGRPYFYNLVSGRTCYRLPGGAALGDVRRLAECEGAADRVMPSRSMLMEGE